MAMNDTIIEDFFEEIFFPSYLRVFIIFSFIHLLVPTITLFPYPYTTLISICLYTMFFYVIVFLDCVFEYVFEEEDVDIDQSNCDKGVQVEDASGGEQLRKKDDKQLRNEKEKWEEERRELIAQLEQATNESKLYQSLLHEADTVIVTRD